MSRISPSPEPPDWPSVEDVPLHSMPLADGCYFVCEFPERPYDATFSSYDWRCRACVRHGEATVACGIDAVPPFAHDRAGGRLKQNLAPLSLSVADAKAWLGLP
jgi:hypothetical protein